MDHSHAWAQRQKAAAGGPQLRKSGGPELRKSGGTQLRKLGGSDQRKFCIASLALLWGVVQVVPFVPASSAHLIWTMSANALGHPLSGTISLNPWESGTALMKIVACAMTTWLACVMTQKAERALMLLKSSSLRDLCAYRS